MGTLIIANLKIIAVYLTHEVGAEGENLLAAQLAELALEIYKRKSEKRRIFLFKFLIFLKNFLNSTYNQPKDEDGWPLIKNFIKKFKFNYN